MRLRDFRNICRKHINEDSCFNCPGYINGKCLFCKPPYKWSNEEIASYVEKLKGESPHGGNSKRRI